MVAGIIVGFILLAVGLTALAGFVGFIIWAYKRFTRKNTSENSSSAESSTGSLIPQTPLVFPPHFGWALASSLLGFHIGLYTYVSYLGPSFRVPALGWAIFAVFSALTWILLLHKSKSLFAYSTIAAATLASVFLAVRANGFVQTWNLLFFLVSQVLLFVYYTYRQLPISVGGWIWSVIFTIPISLMQGIRVFLSVFKKDATSRSKFFGWIKTGVIAFIVLLIFLTLLSQADPVFAEVMREFRSQLVGRWLWTILLIFLFSAWWTTSVDKKDEQESQSSWLANRDVVAILGVVTTVVGVFLVVQFQYLFGGSRQLLETLDLTFSEYVRKGFTELLLAVFIGGILAYLAGAKLRSSAQAPKVITILNTAMIAELALLLLSAFQRDMLYVDTYGLTRVRVIGEVFLIWLAFFLVVLLVYAWKKIREKFALTLLWSGALLVLLSINIFNVDRWVVQGAPGHHEYTDYFYLMQLSEDAGQSWLKQIDAISLDLQPLLEKEQLSDEERAQLAGLKLALMSFVENRDQLYTKYAPESWLLENYQQIGLSLPVKGRETIQKNEWAWNTNLIVDRVANPETKQAAKDVVIPETLAKYRSWEFTNLAEKQTYDLLQSQEEYVFTVPEQLLADILRYQIRTQTNLVTQERRLLFELQYQFITVSLKNYYPMALYQFDTRQWNATRSLVKQEFSALEQQSDLSVAELAGLSCASPQVVQPRELTVYAAARVVSTDDLNPFSNEMKTLELAALGNSSFKPSIKVLMPIDTKVKSMVQMPGNSAELMQEDFYSNGRGVSFVEQYAEVNESDYMFVKAALVPVAYETGSGCGLLFSSSDVRAFYTF